MYECEQSGLSEAKCKQLGFDWFPSGKTTREPITSTTKVCEGSWTDIVVSTTTVAGVGSCVGTLDGCGTGLSCQSTASNVVDPIDSHRCVKNNASMVACCSKGFSICKKGNRCVLDSRLAECEGTASVGYDKPNAFAITKPISVSDKRYKCGYMTNRVYYRSSLKWVTVEVIDRSKVCNAYTRTQNGCTDQQKKDGLWRMCEPFDQCNNLGKYGLCNIDTELSLDLNMSSKYKNVVCDPESADRGNGTCFKATGDKNYKCDYVGNFQGRCVYVR